MNTIAHRDNGSTPGASPQLARRVLARMAAGVALSPTVANILRPALRASLRSDGPQSPLCRKVVAMALDLAASEAERALLQRTRLVDLEADRFLVSVAGADLETNTRERLRELLNHGLARAGLDRYRAKLVFNSGSRGDDCDL